MAESSSGSGENSEFSDESIDSKVEGESQTADESEKGAEESKKGERTIHGAVAIIVYEGPGNTVEFYLEENSQSYALPSERGKLRLVGGTIETTDEGSLDALVRELTEEIESKEAQEILISILMEDKKPYTIVRENVDGKEARTYIYAIKITSPEEWEVVKKSSLTGDAGLRRILSLHYLYEILKKGSEYFAFNSSEVLKQYIAYAYKNIISKKEAPKPYAQYVQLDTSASSAYSSSENINPILPSYVMDLNYTFV